ncbi:MAG: TRAP transporter small permease [Ileibacterium sp.]|nr:TRAP transporter small permease [Ileibacterium sp.]
MIKKVLKWLDAYLEETLLAIFLILMALIMGVQVLSRYVFQTSLSWSEELTRYLFIWSGFLSVSYCSKMCISIKIEQFVAALSRKTRAVVKLINHTIELMFFFYMIPFAWSYMMSAVETVQLSPACHIPMYYVQCAPLISFILVSIRIIQRWIIEAKVALGMPVYDPAHPERNTPESFIEANTESEVMALEAKKEEEDHA